MELVYTMSTVDKTTFRPQSTNHIDPIIMPKTTPGQGKFGSLAGRIILSYVEGG